MSQMEHPLLADLVVPVSGQTQLTA